MNRNKTEQTDQNRDIRVALGLEQPIKRENKKKLLRGLFAALTVIALLAVSFFGDSDLIKGLENTLGGVKQVDNTGFSVSFIDVGQGDCILVVCNNEYALIDCGEKSCADDVIGYLHSMGIEKLDILAATHYHSDHVGAMPEIIETFTPETVIEPGIPESEKSENYYYRNFINSVEENNCSGVTPSVGDCFSIGEAELEIIGPLTDDDENLNNTSLVMTVTYGETVFLLSADAETEEEKELTENNLVPDCDVLKVGHHGSSGSSGEEYLAAARPEYCVISVGADNDYGHPSAKALNRLLEYTDCIYRTDLCGDIVFESDGKNIQVKYENMR